ncbi:unnamed protein product [Spodoptera littoralis]|uniref:Chitin-binding type-2 domain-containing protein n=1 Tax=Spodoptera littoralis TaxID=7109 RepID=A0A9P0IH75_SPOLI|nr:unnamed protein product [Spodoptera littoralis]CAH1645753.1 unnamed protein product [Spodoptera littoralis]
MSKMWIKLVLLSILNFSGSVTTSFDVRALVNGNRMAGVPLGLSLGAGELDVEGICTKPGMACQNCSHAVTCVPLPVGWLKVPLQECNEGLTCNAHQGQCSPDPAPECSGAAQDFDHTCEQVGIFPDAYDCRKFHLCSPPEGLPDGRPADHRAALCPRHYGYNPATAQCSIQLEHSQCSEKPVPECKVIGQHGVLPLSSNHYYVCLIKNGVLHPQVFICPHGWHFWGEFCQPEPEKKIVKDTDDETIKVEHSSEEKIPEEEEKVTTTEKEATTEATATVEATTTKIDSFFSTERTATYAADTFLADKIDLANYETTDDVGAPTNDNFGLSIEYNDWE